MSARVIRRATCRHCHEPIRLVQGVGWLHATSAEPCANPKPRRRWSRR